MRFRLVLAFIGAAIGGGYLGYRTIQRDPPTAPSPRTDATAPEPERAGENLQDKIQRLKDEIARQEKIVADLDAKLNQTDAAARTQESQRLHDDLESQQQLVDSLQRKADDYRAGIGQESSTLQAVKAQNTVDQKTTVAQYQAAIATKQSELRNLRQTLRNRRALNMSMDQVLDAQNKVNSGQAELDGLRAGLTDVRTNGAASRQSQGQMSADLSSARTDQKQLTAQLSDARKKLAEFQKQVNSGDKGLNEGFTHRDQLENQFLAAKQKLEALRQRLANLERRAQRQ